MENNKTSNKTNLKLDNETYNKFNLLKAKYSFKKKEKLDWNEFLGVLLDKERKKQDLINWCYTIGIFIAITFVLMFPIYLFAPISALSLLPVFFIIGFIFAFFSTYILTAWSLRKEMRPFNDAPPEIVQALEDLFKRSGLKKIPNLMIDESADINACAYCSISGNRVALTRGLMDAYGNGKIEKKEVKAILGHELGHLKNYDCLKTGFVLSWISIFEKIGNWVTLIGRAFSHAIDVENNSSESQDGTGLIFAIVGWFSVITGFFMRLIAKIASGLAFHLSRKQEYLADQMGAELVDPDVMANALRNINQLSRDLIEKKISALPYADRWQIQPRNTSWIESLFDTHPPTEKRIVTLTEFKKFL